jgi:hypothetical protein
MDGKRIRGGDRVEMMPGWRRTGLVRPSSQFRGWFLAECQLI